MHIKKNPFSNAIIGVQVWPSTDPISCKVVSHPRIWWEKKWTSIFKRAFALAGPIFICYVLFKFIRFEKGFFICIKKLDFTLGIYILQGRAYVMDDSRKWNNILGIRQISLWREWQKSFKKEIMIHTISIVTVQYYFVKIWDIFFVQILGTWWYVLLLLH